MPKSEQIHWKFWYFLKWNIADTEPISNKRLLWNILLILKLNFVLKCFYGFKKERKKKLGLRYGSFGGGVLLLGIQNYVDFCIEVNRFSGNFDIFWNEIMPSLFLINDFFEKFCW